MFRCHFCHQVTTPGTKRHSVVVATRTKEYPARRIESRRPAGRFQTRRDSAGGDPGGKGVETAREVAACPTCAANHVATPENAE